MKTHTPSKFMNQKLSFESYELNRVADIISRHNYKRIALQFPDSQLIESFDVVQDLKRKCSIKVHSNDSKPEFYVLADSSFGKCCVDIASALHIQADVIFHFGHACFSPVSQLPVYYIFMNMEFYQDPCKSFIESLINTQNIDSNHWIIFSEVCYQRTIISICNQLSLSITSKLFIAIASESSTSTCDCIRCSNIYPGNESIVTLNNYIEHSHKLLGRTLFSIHDENSALEWNISNSNIVFIGQQNSTTLTLLMLMRARYSALKTFIYDPSINTGQENTLTNRSIMKRFHLIEKAVDSQLIGILIAGAALSYTSSVVDALQKMIKKAGKRSFLLSMGKLNPNKLANFLELDVFVLVACEENSITLNQKDYHKPILTPLEFSLSLNPENNALFQIDWNCSMENFMQESHSLNDFQEESTRYSFATGKLNSRKVTQYLNQPKMITYDDDFKQIVSRLKERCYQGLPESFNLNMDLESSIIPGRSGSARTYEQERIFTKE